MPPISTSVRFGSFELDLHSGELRKNGLRIHLGEQPLQVLTLLLEKPGHLVTREELRQRLWASDTFVDFDPSLNAAVKRLREALGDSADNARFIETLPRHGYRFIYPLSATATNDPPSMAEPTATTWEATLRRKMRWWSVAVLIVGAALIPAARRIYHNIRTSQPKAIRAIVVLPLENLSHDSNEEYFSDGMTEALTTELGRIRALRVISHQSARHYKGTTQPVSQIAEELKVDGLVEGSALREGDKVRVSVQLIRVKPEEHVWAKSYEREMKNVLALQSEVARSIAAEIKIQLTPEEMGIARGRTVNPAAYDAYLQGLYKVNRWAPRMEEAVDHFRQAIDADPAYAPAYVGLAESYMLMTLVASMSPKESLTKAEAAIAAAMTLDPNLADAYRVRARIRTYYSDWSGAEADYKQALQLNPSSARIHSMYGWYLTWLGRFDESSREENLAIDRDPMSLFAIRAVGMNFFCQHQYDKALAEFRRAIEIDPENIVVNGDIGRIYIQTGKYEAAIAQLESARRLAGETGGSISPDGYLGMAYALAGRRADALKILDDLKKRSKQSYVSPLNIAMIYVGLDDKERAMEWLEKGVEAQDGDLVVLKVFPIWDPLRSDPRFQTLLRRMNFPQ